jgi:methyltransferase (TIGR00027 family)
MSTVNAQPSNTQPPKQAKTHQARLAAGKPSRTAEITAQLRASDARLRRRRQLLGDSYARLFVRNPWYRMLRLTPETSLMGLKIFDRACGGLTAEIVLRTRHFDDELVAAAANGIEQVVLVGAGYDSSALRHPELSRVTFFEIDHPSTQRAKLAILDRHSLHRPNVVFAPLDLERGQRLSTVLQEAGFNPTRPCLIGWHGVSFFLTPEAFQQALLGMAMLCAPGSRLVFDYMDESVIDGTTHYRGAIRASANVAAAGEKYRNGLSFESASRAAADAGFRTVEHLRVTDLVRRYGGEHPYCRDDDFMGLLTLERTSALSR